MTAKKIIAFNISKQETHSIDKQYKKLYQSLRIRHKVVSHDNSSGGSSSNNNIKNEHDDEEDELTLESIKSYDILIFANPQIDFTSNECQVISKFINEEGKSVAFFGCGGGSGDNNNNIRIRLPNISNLLMEHGIIFENDTVVRTSFYKYLHPKQVFIGDGVLHPTLNCSLDSSSDVEYKGNHMMFDKNESMEEKEEEDKNKELKVVYVNGSTLDATTPSLPILSSGAISFPANRPIIAVSSGQRNTGKIVAVGSSDMFANEWIEKEGNTTLFNVLMNFLLQNDKVTFERSKSRKDNRIDDAKVVPDIEALSERLRSCLEENRPLPQDINSLLIQDMITYDTRMISEVVDLYDELNVKKEPLTLIPPEFERPIPPLKLAVFHPKMKEMPFPALDKFDLDEEFAESSVRLERLTNSCTDEDLDYYVQEAGSIAGLVDEQETNVEAKVVLHRLFKQIVKFKCDERSLEKRNMPIKKIEITQM